MNEEMTGKCLRQVEHIRGHLWHKYSITVTQVMVATVKHWNWWLQLNQDRATRTPPKNGGELKFQLIKSNIKNNINNSVILKVETTKIYEEKFVGLKKIQ